MILSTVVVLQFHCWPSWRQWCYLQMILSCWALEYGRLDTLNIKIRLQMAEIIFEFYFWPLGRQWHNLQMILSCQALQYGRLDTLNIKICLETAEKIFLVPFLATTKTMVPLANDPIMQKRLIRWFRHLEHQNPSIIQGDIGRASQM